MAVDGWLIRRSQVRALVGEPLRGSSGHAHEVAWISRCSLRERGVAADDLHFAFILSDFLHQQAQVFLGECVRDRGNKIMLPGRY